MEEQVEINDTAAAAEKPKRSKTKRNVLIVVLSLCIAIMLFVWVVVSYLLYVICSFSRLPGTVKLSVSDNKTEELAAGGSYSIMTYNVGFGAYSPDYTFFMDTGKWRTAQRQPENTARRGAVKRLKTT